MQEMNALINDILQDNPDQTRQKLLGRNALMKNLFRFLYNQSGHTCPLLLCTDAGLVVDYTGQTSEHHISGRRLTQDSLDALKNAFTVYRAQDYMLLSSTDTACTEAAAAIFQSLEQLLKIVDTEDLHNQHLLNCLDSMRNAISIYDKEAHLLFCNRTFCSNLHIKDRDIALGMHADDLLKYHNVKIYSMENNSNHMKMMDVLEKGIEVLDWEVRLESQDHPNKAQLVSNDMYPILDAFGNVQGMVELMRSRQQDMKRTKKMVGLTAEYTFDDIVGISPIMRERIRLAKEFANSPFNFLITGESGVGKELFAQSIHNYSSRSREPFVALNCANFSEGLIESELFGYVSGAFTGASKNGQIGKFELADGGTLFLDEIGELPYHFQSKLLRVLETWLVTRIGSSKEIPVNVRIIAATNRDLEQMVAEGLFRQDLYYRLQVLNVDIPPLRDRRQDIPLLAETFLRQASDPSSDQLKTLDADAQQALMEYDWPGNVRELRNVINRVTVLSKTDVITRDVLETSIYSKGFVRKAQVDNSPQERMDKRHLEIDNAYANLLKEALDITGGNKKRAAALLGVSRKTFYRMLEKYCKV